MNFSFADTFRSLLRLLYVAAVLKLLTLAALPLLPRNGIEKIETPDIRLPYIHPDMQRLLFGVPEHQTGRQTVSKRLPTLQNFTLLGIFRQDDRHGWIVIAQKGKKETKILAVGERLQGKRLVRIGEDAAIFEANGRKYRLFFKKTPIKGVLKEQINETPSEPVRALSKQTVMHYAKDFRAIWKNIAIDDVRKNGKIIGFKIKRITPDSIFDRLGLQKGDIIVSVNGHPMTTYKAAFDLYRRVGKIKSLNITVLRNGTTKELEYEIY